LEKRKLQKKKGYRKKVEQRLLRRAARLVNELVNDTAAVPPTAPGSGGDNEEYAKDAFEDDEDDGDDDENEEEDQDNDGDATASGHADLARPPSTPAPPPPFDAPNAIVINAAAAAAAAAAIVDDAAAPARQDGGRRKSRRSSSTVAKEKEKHLEATLTKKQKKRCMKHGAAISIQAVWQGHLTRRVLLIKVAGTGRLLLSRLRLLRRATLRVQALVRGVLAREKVAAPRCEYRAARQVQSLARRKEARAEVGRRREVRRREHAATSVQSAQRSKRARGELQQRRAAWRLRAMIVAQSFGRVVLASRKRSEKLDLLRMQQAMHRKEDERQRAAIIVQGGARGRQARVVVDRRREGVRQRETYERKKEERASAATVLQSGVRAKAARDVANRHREERRQQQRRAQAEQEQQQRVQAAVMIQSSGRRRTAVATAQGKREMVVRKREHERLKEEERQGGATMIQTQVRAKQARKQRKRMVDVERRQRKKAAEDEASVRIGCAVRGKQARTMAEKRRRAAATAAKKQRAADETAAKQDAAAALIQRNFTVVRGWRAKMKMLSIAKRHRQRLHLQETSLKRNRSIVRMQSRARRKSATRIVNGQRMSMQYQADRKTKRARKQHAAATSIQMVIRRRWLRKTFKKLTYAQLQHQKLAKREGRRQRSALSIQNAARRRQAQQTYARKREMVAINRRRIEENGAAVVIQSSGRRKGAEREAKARREALIRMEQRKVRKTKLMKTINQVGMGAKMKREKQQRGWGALKIQSVYRGTTERQKITHRRESLHQKKILAYKKVERERAAVNIQAGVRGSRERSRVASRRAGQHEKQRIDQRARATFDITDLGKINDAATTIQAKQRQRDARKEVGAQRQRVGAATMIQTKRRQTNAAKDVGNRREQSGAATMIQAKRRQTNARREVGERREANETAEWELRLKKGERIATVDDGSTYLIMSILEEPESDGAAAGRSVRVEGYEFATTASYALRVDGSKLRELSLLGSEEQSVSDEGCNMLLSLLRVEGGAMKLKADDEVDRLISEAEQRGMAAATIQAKRRQTNARREVGERREAHTAVGALFADMHDTAVDAGGLLRLDGLREGASSAGVQYKLHVGDVVQAKPPDEMLYFEGVVVELHEDGSADIDFGDEDDDEEAGTSTDGKDVLRYTRVSAASIRRAMVWSALEVGDHVKARYQGGYQQFEAIVIAAHNDGTYDVQYDDDEVEERMAEDMLTKILSGRMQATRRWNKAKAMLSAVSVFRHAPTEAEKKRADGVARHREARKTVAMLNKQKEDEEKTDAATMIQTKRRQTNARKGVGERREQSGAATTIQAKRRQTNARKEVNVRREAHARSAVDELWDEFSTEAVEPPTNIEDAAAAAAAAPAAPAERGAAEGGKGGGGIDSGGPLLVLLASQGLEGYYDAFIADGWESVDDVEHLSEQELLEDMGMKKGHARRLMKALANEGN
jgi:hypothetical protein